MAEYYPLLAKAVASLPSSTPEARHAIYERARQALFRQLRSLDPPIPEADVERESRSLEEAVARLETELAPAVEIAAEPQEEPIPPLDGAQRVEEVARGEPLDTAPARKPVEPDAPKSEAAAPAPPPRSTRPPSLLFKARRDSAPPASQPRSQRPINGIASLDGPAEPLPEAGNEGQLGAAGDAVAPSPIPLALAPDANGAASPEISAAKMRPEAQRPLAPLPPREASAPKRLWIVGVVVAVLVALVAIAAFVSRDKPEDLARQKAALVPAPSEAASSGKIVERIGVGAAAPESADAIAAAPGDERTKNGGEPANPPVSVALRAALLVEASDEKSKVKTFLGSVVWRVDNVSNGPGEPLSTAVRAEVDIPEEKLQAAMTLQKNLDGSLPASHTMNVRFVAPAGGPLGLIQQISVPQMRREDTATGSALAGIPVPITENSFLVGLSRGAAEAANLDLLRTREWVDVPMVLSDGRIAKLTFEKGRSGQRAIDDALASWQAQ